MHFLWASIDLAHTVAGFFFFSVPDLFNILKRRRTLVCRKEETKLVAENGKLVEVVERSGVVPNGTGFTITTGGAPDLNRTHLIVGKVIEGMDVVAQLDKLPVVKNNKNSPFFIVGKAAGDKRANVAELGFDRPFKKVAVATAGIVEQVT